MTDLTQLGAHFAFGDNWARYAEAISEREIDQAVRGLKRLLATDSLVGRTFLDIGCGSGLHSLAALRLGATRVSACDIDPISVRTTEAVLQQFAPSASYEINERSVFALDPRALGKFDVVYSWGVLHHTGDLVRALHVAASLVTPAGLFAFALYQKTLLCPLWKLEKRWYAVAAKRQQELARRIYLAGHSARLRLFGKTLATYVASYKSNRGMDFYHDVHDWLGGHPYESMSPYEVDQLMQAQQFEHVRSFTVAGARRPIGLFGSGCNEFVYRAGPARLAHGSSLGASSPQ